MSAPAPAAAAAAAAAPATGAVRTYLHKHSWSLMSATVVSMFGFGLVGYAAYLFVYLDERRLDEEHEPAMPDTTEKRAAYVRLLRSLLLAAGIVLVAIVWLPLLLERMHRAPAPAVDGGAKGAPDGKAQR